MESNGGNAIVAVRDTGIGIAEQDHEKIFERFYRVDKARSRACGGTGIGLAIADWITKQHSGSIAVQSSMGRGSTFLVELPLQPASGSIGKTTPGKIQTAHTFDLAKEESSSGSASS